ncbi:hypothetical protein JCM30566_05540 [Marinitoga arctica]
MKIYNLSNPEDLKFDKKYDLMSGAQTAGFGKSGKYYYIIYFGGSGENSGIYVQFIDNDFNIMENRKVKISNYPYIVNFAFNQNEYIINDGMNKYYFNVTDDFSKENLISVNYDVTAGNYIRFYSFDGNKFYIVDGGKLKVYKFEDNELKSDYNIDINYDEKINESGNYIEHPHFIIINKIENYLNISILYLDSINGYNFGVSKYYYYIYDIGNKKIIYYDSDDSENADENYRKINPIVFKYH